MRIALVYIVNYSDIIIIYYAVINLVSKASDFWWSVYVAYGTCTSLVVNKQNGKDWKDACCCWLSVEFIYCLPRVGRFLGWDMGTHGHLFSNCNWQIVWLCIATGPEYEYKLGNTSNMWSFNQYRGRRLLVSLTFLFIACAREDDTG